ncbi:guanylate kinase [Massiliimalia massiliensis]|uniref:guanylate kinase n=1 Tax=Massiliimalia massiliensis TaxID=1852384 RepID=UPI000987373A|nr:guanylate kinase [Massiliimalia massiliensis]
MNKKGLLLILSGPSGCGKGTVLKELLAAEPNIFYSVSATTRAPRPGEEDGVNYFFLSKEEFDREVSQDGMLEYACYCGNCYGTPKKPVFDRLERGEHVILEIEVQGAKQVMESCTEAVSIFIMPPSLAELERRLVDRQTEDEEAVKRRLAAAVDEMNLAKDYDYVVVNDKVSEAVKDIAAIIRAEQNRSCRMSELIG